jgi:hypothetical protein
MKIKGRKYNIRRLKMQGARFKVQGAKLRFKVQGYVLKTFYVVFLTLNIQL